MKLRDLLQAVNEKNLTKTQIEEYRDSLAQLFALMHLEMADLEKAEAMYFDTSTEATDVAKKRKWNATPDGQRFIELKHFTKGTEKVLSSLKSRLYNTY